jgi:hypothetical protein
MSIVKEIRSFQLQSHLLHLHVYLGKCFQLQSLRASFTATVTFFPALAHYQVESDLSAGPVAVVAQLLNHPHFRYYPITTMNPHNLRLAEFLPLKGLLCHL